MPPSFRVSDGWAGSNGKEAADTAAESYARGERRDKGILLMW